MSQYVALIRGINVGGHKQIKMSELKTLFVELGYTDIRTVLASGNVVFDSEIQDEIEIRRLIENALLKHFTTPTSVMVRTLDSITALVESNPFGDVVVGVQARLYVSFVNHEIEDQPQLSHDLNISSYSIICANNQTVCGVIQLTPDFGTLEYMAILENQFGNDITTRTWKTVLKILEHTKQPV
jgi:uncharacterized protein (DUF1697 family)